ncbi:uncharacterized protein [Spinacia oleracea]|uniref:Transposase n=1 Tax=Spinacia oleracea TaxID=3562 RepID=A0A9R0JFX4_SPIOL|nr:uncharacterized protein LOC110805062 [Spinacia oleracea]
MPQKAKHQSRSICLAMLYLRCSTVVKGKNYQTTQQLNQTITDRSQQNNEIALVLQEIDANSIDESPYFEDMYNTIRIDEKWFYMTKGKQRYYLLAGENRPYRHCKSKRFIAKVMFLAVVARPRFNDVGECTFDGKLGIFPFVKWVPAKRRSKNRPAGTPELKAINSVTNNAYRRMLIRQLIPAIQEKWPTDHEGPIFIQQDNATPHIQTDDADWLEEIKESNKDSRLVFQPPIDPDLNALDLGFFRAIQSLKDQTTPTTYQQLLGSVKDAFNLFCPIKGNRIFLSLQLVLIQIMKAKGSNDYQLAHISKESLARQGILPTVLFPSPELVQETLDYLQAMEVQSW